MIGCLGVARGTFDIKFAEKKFIEAKKILIFPTHEFKGFDRLIAVAIGEAAETSIKENRVVKMSEFDFKSKKIS